MNFIRKILSTGFFQRKQKIKAIVGIDENNGIGNNGELLFAIKEDMKHFTELTRGAVVIMGSKTYDSIPPKFRPLKNRINIVLSRQKGIFADEDIIIAHSLAEALEQGEKYHKDIWIIGGEAVYRESLPMVDEIYITQMFAQKEADTFFPRFKDGFNCIDTSEMNFDEKNQIEFQFQTWQKNSKA